MSKKFKDNPKSFIDHILELRTTLLKSLIYIVIGMIVCIVFYENIFNFLIMPIKNSISNSKIIYTSITEPITTEFKISFYVGFMLSLPFILNNIWSFIKPGLYENEKIIIKKYTFFITILFVCGIFFAYYIVIPNILNTLTKIASTKLIFLPQLSSNISFVITIMISFGLSFELPLFMILLDKINVLPFHKQKKMWREYITIIIIISALITPPDILSMLFLACPLLFLYFITMAYHHFFSMKKNKI